MAQILVRNIDTETLGRLKQRASDRGRSLQAEVKSILEQAAVIDAATARALAGRIRRRFRGRRFDDSTELIREDRER